MSESKSDSERLVASTTSPEYPQKVEVGGRSALPSRADSARRHQLQFRLSNFAETPPSERV